MWEGQDRVQVAASPEAVWKVIADIEGHARLAGSGEILAVRFQGPLRVGAEATGLLVALPAEVADRARALYGPMA